MSCSSITYSFIKQFIRLPCNIYVLHTSNHTYVQIVWKRKNYQSKYWAYIIHNQMFFTIQKSSNNQTKTQNFLLAFDEEILFHIGILILLQ